MELTLEQKIASSFDRNLSVTANAGSGKTKVLVDRYIDILTDSEKLSLESLGRIKVSKDPAEIVAITFTKKAAAEMKEKINRVLEEKIQSAENKEKHHLINLRNKMIYANVSTIHSFCNKLMKDYPIEADIQPNFGELSELETRDLINSKIKKFIYQKTSYQEGSEKIDDENLEKLIYYFGKKTLISYLEHLVKEEYELFKLKQFYDENKDTLLGDIEDYYYEKYGKIAKTLNSNLAKFYNQIDTTGFKPKKIDAFQKSKQNYEHLKNIEISDFEKLKEFSNNVSSIVVSGIIKVDFKTDKYFASRFPDLDIYLEGLPDLIKIKDTLENSEYDEDLIIYSIMLVDYAIEILEQVNKEKDLSAKYNFDDMMIKALKILEDEKVIMELKSKIKYLMIDEFQDTNALQYEIVKKLISTLSDPTSESPINLFIVGDTKQSIYAFRKADVRVFAKAMQDISISNQVQFRDVEYPFVSKYDIPDNFDKSLIFGNSKLTTTFRLQPVIGAFLNDFFAKIMIKTDSEFSVDYEKFAIGRNANAEKPNELGTVNLLLNTTTYDERKSKGVKTENIEEEFEEQDINKTESLMIARKILEIVNAPKDENRYLIQNGDKYERAKYSDMYILARRRKDLEVLAEELRGNKIPYVLHSGAGFYNTSEIKDIISYLNFIVNKDDDIALLSVLRSKFFEFSDNEIFILKTFIHEKSFFDKLKKLVYEIQNNNVDLTAIDKEKILDTYEFLNSAVSLAPSMTIQSIIRRLVEKTFYLTKLSENNRFEQIHANIEKIIEESREYENPGFRTMYDFIKELNYNLDNSAKDSEATVITGDNAVNLMTIHASKGLDAPVVFVISANAGTNTKLPDIFKNDKYGLVFKIPDIDSEDLEKITTPLRFLAEQDERENLSFEELRLFYVALTRAKDHLFITATGDINSNKNGFNKFKSFFALMVNGFSDAFGIDLSEFMMTKAVNEIKLNSSLDMYNAGNNFKIDSFDYKLNFEFEPVENKYNPNIAIDKALMNAEFIFDEIELMFTNENISPSQIHALKKDKAEFIENYIYGLDAKRFEIKNANNEFETGNAGQLNALAKGVALHYVFEQINEWHSFEKEVTKDELVEILKTYEDYKELSQATIDKIIDEVINTSSTKLFKESIKFKDDWQQELSFRIPYQKDFLKGVIDLIFKNQNGDYIVWDWKSNFVREISYIPNMAKGYENQMKFYCYIVSKLFPEQKNFEARLIFTNAAQKDSNDEDFTYKFEWKKEDIINFDLEIAGMIAEIKSLYL